MYSTQYRDELPEPVAREFDALASVLKRFLLSEHHVDGTHRFDLDSSGAISATIQQLVDRSQEQGQWWKRGPWLLDDPDAAEPDGVILDSPLLSAGTYDNFAPTDIDTSIGVEIEGDGDITLTGIKAIESARHKRFLWIHNRSTTYSVSLSHLDAGSLDEYQFDFSPGVQPIVIAPNQWTWLYWNPRLQKWTLGFAGSITVTTPVTGAVLTVTVDVSTADLVAGFKELLVAQGSGIAIIPIGASLQLIPETYGFYSALASSASVLLEDSNPSLLQTVVQYNTDSPLYNPLLHTFEQTSGGYVSGNNVPVNMSFSPLDPDEDLFEIGTMTGSVVIDTPGSGYTVGSVLDVVNDFNDLSNISDVDQGSRQFVVGVARRFATTLLVFGSTGNDGVYTITNIVVTQTSPSIEITITVAEAIPNGTADGQVVTTGGGLITVDAVDGGGGITAASILNGGVGYAATTTYQTQLRSGAGDGLAEIDSLTISSLTDLHGRASMAYYLMVLG